jgi:hypothetical protein
MPKGQQRGNKEAKKAKKAPVPPPMAAGPVQVPTHKAAPPRSLKK